jgi:hypothetical protein
MCPSRCTTALTHSYAEALRTTQSVDVATLSVGLPLVDGGAAAQTLRHFGLTPARLRDQLSSLRTPSTPAPAAVPTAERRRGHRPRDATELAADQLTIVSVTFLEDRDGQALVRLPGAFHAVRHDSGHRRSGCRSSLYRRFCATCHRHEPTQTTRRFPGQPLNAGLIGGQQQNRRLCSHPSVPQRKCLHPVAVQTARDEHAVASQPRSPRTTGHGQQRATMTPLQHEYTTRTTSCNSASLLVVPS